MIMIGIDIGNNRERKEDYFGIYYIWYSKICGSFKIDGI